MDIISKGAESCHNLDIDIRALYSRTARKGVMSLPDPAAGETDALTKHKHSHRSRQALLRC